jgi:hypothetical protein
MADEMNIATAMRDFHCGKLPPTKFEAFGEFIDLVNACEDRCCGRPHSPGAHGRAYHPHHGKPLERLVDDVKKGILDLKAKLDPLEDCAKAAAHFLWAEMSGTSADSATYADEWKTSTCDVAGWAECLTTYLAYKAHLISSPPPNSLNGASATVDYYEVPPLQGAKKFSVTDMA